MIKEEVIKILKSHENPKNVEGMARFGINSNKTLGVSIPIIRKLAKDIGKNHKLALDLWESEIHEARILASMIDEKEKVDEKQMEKWVKDFDSWDVCDQVCMNLFENLPLAYQKAIEWSKQEEEFVKRAGFVLMARLSTLSKKIEDSKLLEFFPYIKKEATDERNFVKKAVNWALRQIGKRNENLNKKAIELAQEIQKIENKAAKWIASDALKELKNYDFN